MKKAKIVLVGGLQLECDVTPKEAYALERGVRTGEGLCRGHDVTIACRHVLAYSIEDIDEKEEENTDEG